MTPQPFVRPARKRLEDDAENEDSSSLNLWPACVIAS
jgi:hypothetical protein